MNTTSIVCGCSGCAWLNAFSESSTQHLRAVHPQLTATTTSQSLLHILFISDVAFYCFYCIPFYCTLETLTD